MIISAIIALLLSPVFNIQTIEVVGNKQISKEEIKSLSGIEIYENLFKVINKKVENNIKENAYINTVKVSKKIPDRIHIEVEEREVLFDEVKDFAECGLCGTAAVISPVGKINDHGKEICFPSGMDEMGPITKKLYDTLTGIQMGRIEAPEGWIKEIK